MQRPLIQSDYLLSHNVKLSLPGKVLVHVGKQIEVGGLVAEATLPTKFQVFDVLNHFRLQPHELEGCIKRLAGEDVQKGDVIARKPGILSRIFRAPEAGKVVAVRDGRVTLAMGEKTNQAISPIAGVVSELIAGLGAQIVSQGNNVQAAWGNGKISVGQFLFVDKPENYDKKDLDGRVIGLSEPLTIPILNALQASRVAGVVAPALNPLLIDAYTNWMVPLLSLAGFGEAGFDPVTLKVLKSFEEKQVYLMGHKPSQHNGQKPSLFLPKPANQTGALFEEDNRELPGKKVRLLGMPYFGSVGKIIEIPEQEERLGSGVLSKVVVVERDDETIIRVPLENLSILSY